MQYTSKPTTVEAVRWEAPTDAESDGNLAELQEFAGDLAEVRKQDPWNPAEGQNCALLVIPTPPAYLDKLQEAGEPTAGIEEAVQVIPPGSYLVRAGNWLDVLSGEDFEAHYDTSNASATGLAGTLPGPLPGGGDPASATAQPISDPPTE